MKAFKGCTNEDCKAYKKIHYKENDEFCLKCGQPLNYVCADCWKTLEDNKNKYCISCKTKREQDRAQTWDKVKNTGGKVVPGVGAVAIGIKQLSKDTKTIQNGVKELGKVANAVAKAVAKAVKK